MIGTPLREEDVAMMHKMFQCRTTARFILGDRYASAMEEWSEVIAAQMAREKQSILQATIALGQRINPHDAVPLMCLMSAAVDMIEKADSYEPPEPDGEAFRGGEAAGFERETQARIQRDLK